MTWHWLICTSLLAPPLVAATVSGRVQLDDSREPAVRRKLDYSGVVVWLEPSARGTPTAPARARMVQKDKMFMPHVLAVSVAQRLSFRTTTDLPQRLFKLRRAGVRHRALSARHLTQCHFLTPRDSAGVLQHPRRHERGDCSGAGRLVCHQRARRQLRDSRCPAGPVPVARLSRTRHRGDVEFAGTRGERERRCAGTAGAKHLRKWIPGDSARQQVRHAYPPAGGDGIFYPPARK